MRDIQGFYISPEKPAIIFFTFFGSKEKWLKNSDIPTTLLLSSELISQ